MNKLSGKQVAGVVLAAIGGVLGVIGFAAFLATPRYPWSGIAVWIASFDLLIPGVVLLVLGRKAARQPPAALPFVLPETRRSRLRRALLLVGSVILLVSVLLPWFTVTVTYAVSGSGHVDLPNDAPLASPIPEGREHVGRPGTYDGLDSTEALGYLGGGLFAYAAFVGLILVAVIGVTSALVVRRFSWFGISGILVLALYAIGMFVGMNQLGAPYQNRSVGFAYGFFLAVIGSALIETGARLKRPAGMVAPLRTPLPLGILLIGLGVVCVVGGFLASISPSAASSDQGIFLMVLGIASALGGLFALISPTRAPPSPGILLTFLGVVSSIGASFALIFFGTLFVQYDDLFDIWTVAVFFGVMTFLVGVVAVAKPSMASPLARPYISR